MPKYLTVVPYSCPGCNDPEGMNTQRDTIEAETREQAGELAVKLLKARHTDENLKIGKGHGIKLENLMAVPVTDVAKEIEQLAQVEKLEAELSANLEDLIQSLAGKLSDKIGSPVKVVSLDSRKAEDAELLKSLGIR